MAINFFLFLISTQNLPKKENIQYSKLANKYFQPKLAKIYARIKPQ